MLALRGYIRQRMMMLVNNLCINKIFIHLEIFESIQITKAYRESKKVETELYLIEWY